MLLHVLEGLQAASTDAHQSCKIHSFMHLYPTPDVCTAHLKLTEGSQGGLFALLYSLNEKNP